MRTFTFNCQLKILRWFRKAELKLLLKSRKLINFWGI